MSGRAGRGVVGAASTWVRLMVASLAVFSVGCGDDPPRLATTSQAAIVPNPAPGTFAVYTSNSFLTSDRARVTGGNVGTRIATGGPHLQTEFEGAVGLDGVLDTAWGVYADTLRLQTRAVVGNVYTNSLTNLGATFGVLSPFQTLAAFPALPSFTPGATNVTVPSGVTQLLAPGAYNTVSVQGRLQLQAGAFRFRSLFLGPDAVVEARGVLQVRIFERVAVSDRGRFEIGSGLGLTARSAVYVVRGSNGTNGPWGTPAAFQAGNDAILRGLLFAPNGTVQVGQRSTFTGAIFARDALLDLDSRVTFEDGFTCATNCDDGNPCTVDTCNLAICQHANAANGTSCNDSTVCNGQETCSNGTCTGGTPPVLDDGNPCTVDSCHPTQGVSHPPAPVGTPCPDSNLCNGAETCNGASACVAGLPLDPDDDNPCTTDSCNPSTGAEHTPVAAGMPCADGNLCNGDETCDGAGECEYGPPLVSDDGNPCTFDACDPEDGVTHTPLAAGTSCADEDPCDGEETCSAEAECQGVAPDPLPDECNDDPPMSTRCGDAIRDPVTEECDDGPGSALDACDETCRVQDAPVDPLARVEGERRSRSLGFGRHPLASGTRGTLLTFTELDGSAHALRGAHFSANGNARSVVDIGLGASPSQWADASVAAMSPDVFAVAWNELGDGSLDVGLRLVRAGETPSLGELILANATRERAQQDPDLVWIGSELIVAWASDGVIHARHFDRKLNPIGTEQQLSLSDEVAGSVSVSRFGDGWAAAWRVVDEEEGEAIAVYAAGVTWSVGPFPPGAELERPALVELDDANLLVVFTEGTDPLDTGTASVTRLRGAVLNVEMPGLADAFPFESLVEPYATDETIAQSRPTLARVGSELFLGWETEGLAGDELESEVWLQELDWSVGTGVVFAIERAIQVTHPREDAQFAPAFAPSPLQPGGALALTFEEHAPTWPYGARPDVIFSLRPVPIVTLSGN